MAFTNNPPLNHIRTEPNDGQIPYNMHLAGMMPHSVMNFPPNFAVPGSSSYMNTTPLNHITTGPYPMANEVSPLNLNIKPNLPVTETQDDKYNQSVTAAQGQISTRGLCGNAFSQTKNTSLPFKQVQHDIIEKVYNSMKDKSSDDLQKPQYTSSNIGNIPYSPAPTGYLDNLSHRDFIKKEAKKHQTAREIAQLSQTQTNKMAQINKTAQTPGSNDDHQCPSSTINTNNDSNIKQEPKTETVNDKPSCSFSQSCSNIVPSLESSKTERTAIPMSISSNKTTDRIHVCNFCNKAFKRKDHLNRHKNKFHVNKPSAESTESSSCSISTTTTPELNCQSNTNNITHPACTLPSMTFKEYNLNPQVQELINKEFPYECSDCCKVFTRKDHVQRHKVTHSNVKPYECDLCLKIFSRKDHLKRHRNGHTKDILYDCQHCDKSFTRKDHLDRHLQKHHMPKKEIIVNDA